MGTLQFRAPPERYDPKDEAQVRSAIEQNSRTVNAKLNQTSWLWSNFGASSTYYSQTSSESSAGVTPVSYGYPYLHLYRYATNTTPGTTSMASALQTVADLLAVTGGIAVIPPDAILINSQVTFSFPNDRCSAVYGYGCSITTGSLASYPFKLSSASSGQQGAPVLAGLYVNHWSNTATPGVFEFSNAHHITLRDIGVQKPNNPASGYAVVYIHQSTAADSATGSFWNALERCNFRPNTTPTAKSTDVWIKGDGNATKILNCSFSQSDIAILHEIEASASYIANALLVQGCDFENYTTMYQLKSSVAAVNSGGARFIGNRYEAGTTIYDLAGGTTPVTQQPAVPNFSFGNYMTSNAGTYLNNTNSLYFNSLDLSVTPDGRAIFITDDTAAALTVENVSATGGGVAAQTATAMAAVSIQNRGGSTTFGNIRGVSGGLVFDTHPSDSAVHIADKTASVNTSNKLTGKLVWDTTNNRMMRASGTTDVSAWYVIDGSASVTPA